MLIEQVLDFVHRSIAGASSVTAYAAPEQVPEPKSAISQEVKSHFPS